MNSEYGGLYFIPLIILICSIILSVTDFDVGEYVHSNRNLVLTSIASTIFIYCILH